MTTEERVKKIISERIEVNPIYNNHDFIDDLGADSIDQVEIIMAIEDEFSIEIPDEDSDKIKTVDDVIKYVERKI